MIDYKDLIEHGIMDEESILCILRLRSLVVALTLPAFAESFHLHWRVSMIWEITK